jgi:hypothetical protein
MSGKSDEIPADVRKVAVNELGQGKAGEGAAASELVEDKLGEVEGERGKGVGVIVGVGSSRGSEVQQRGYGGIAGGGARAGRQQLD